MKIFEEKYIARLEHGSVIGTAFLISNRFLLTAYHNVNSVQDSNVIKIELDTLFDQPFEAIATLRDFDVDADVALLELISPLEDQDHLTPTVEAIRNRAQWDTLGFPNGKQNAGARLDGIVARANLNIKNVGYELDLNYNHGLGQLGGLSGSPLFIDDKLVGIITKELDNSLGGISIAAFASLLERNNVNFYKKDSIGFRSKPHIELNYPVIEALHNKIVELESGYVFLKGNPGSGKTTIVESLDLNQENIVFLDKYIIREEGKENFVAVRISEINFLTWLEDSIFADLYNTIPPQSERSVSKWQEEIIQLLQTLSQKYTEQNRKCVLLIDGIEELVLSKKIDDFFQVLPIKLPKNIIIVIAGQNEESLPLKHRVLVATSIIVVTPLPKELCQSLTDHELPSLPFDLRQKIVDKSEFHPLYLRYITEYAKKTFITPIDLEKVEHWIGSLPKVDGEIKLYYENIWQMIKNDLNLRYLISLISRLREGISVETLVRIVPANLKNGLESYLDSLSHLLISRKEIWVYHSSLADFISEKTGLIEEGLHSTISNFCVNNLENMYSCRNILWHILKSEQTVKDNIINYCGQSWADSCTKYFIEPDLILSDLKDVLALCMGSQDLTAVIKILLLSQRIKFRYNNILSEYAFEMTDYLIESNKPVEAVNHIFRRSIPLLSYGDIVHFEYKLLIKECFEEANFLFSTIYDRFLMEYESGSISYSDLLSTFISLSFSKCLQSENPAYESSEIMRLLSQIIKSSEDDDSAELEKKQKFKIYILSHNIALLIIHRDFYVPLEKIEQKGVPLDCTYTFALVQTYNFIKEFTSINGISFNDNKLVSDIEYALVKYEPENVDLAVVAELLDDINIKYEVLKNIIEQYNSDGSQELRLENGVDLNLKWHHYIFTKAKHKGFLDQITNYPKLIQFLPATWEVSLESIVSYVGYLSGHAWQLRAKGMRTDQLATGVVESIFPVLKFDLMARVSFDRSYLIVEDLMPIIYEKVLDFYLIYAEEQLNKFLEFILQHTDKQLGIYTEGFRGVISIIIKKLVLKVKYRKQVFSLLKKLEDHVLLGVQNRWDRCQELINIAKYYRILGSSRADTVFQELLNSSMGPSWYKEDQLTLIRTATDLIKPHQADWSAKELAGVLDFASGEMTFQRYIRMEKEELIGSLCSVGKLNKAIQYFQHESFPVDYLTILNRAEALQIDNLDIGKGYSFGVKLIDEQSGILNIIENTKNIKNSLKWLFSELFLIGDDRYLSQFSSIFSQILNDEETAGSIHLKFYRNRIIRILLTDMDVNIRKKFVEELKNGLSKSNYLQLIQLIAKSKMKCDLPIEKESEVARSTSLEDSGGDEERASGIERSLYLPGTFGKQKGIADFHSHYSNAEEALEIENNEVAKEQLILSLRALQNSGWGIWSDNLAQSDLVFDKLKSISDENEILRLLSPLILSELYTPDWKIADKIVSKLGRFLSDSSAKQLYNVVIEHIKIMVNPPLQSIEDFTWMDSPTLEQFSNENLLFNFFLYFLDHPSPVIHHRAPEILKSFSRLEPDFFIPILIDHSLSNKKGYSPEICSGILYSLVLESVEGVNRNIKIGTALPNILSCTHLVIKHTWFEIIKLINAQNASMLTEESAIRSNLFTSTKPKSDFVENSNSVAQIKKDLGRDLAHIFSKLGKIGVWSDSDYGLLEEFISQGNSNLNLDALIRIDHYVSNGYHQGDRNYFLKAQVLTALNNILLSRVTEQNISTVIEIMRLYNPFFPNESVRLGSARSLDNDLKLFVSGETKNPSLFLREGKDEYLHYIEVIHSEETNTMKFIEISASLTRFTEFKPEQLVKPKQFKANQNPITEYAAFKNTFMYSTTLGPNYFGGRMTPSILNASFDALPSNLKNESYMDSWIEGRKWNVHQLGMPLREGSRLLVSSEVIDRLLARGWRLIWHVNYNDTNHFLIDRTAKQIYSLD